MDWQERQQLLKVKFDVNIRATEAIFDIQHGNVKRPTHWNTSWDIAKFETVGHQWADVAQMDYGVALFERLQIRLRYQRQSAAIIFIKRSNIPGSSGRSWFPHAYLQPISASRRFCNWSG